MYKPKTNRDHNQEQIVKAIKQLGCTVLDLAAMGGGCPDILVGVTGKTGKYNILLEIKNKSLLRDSQKLFVNNWKGQTAVVRTVDEALFVCKYYLNK